MAAATAGNECYVRAGGGGVEDDAVGWEEGERWICSCERGEEAGDEGINCCFGKVVFG